MIQKKNLPDQPKDTGMAMVLIFLLFTYFGHYPYLALPAIITLVLVMTWPSIFRPLAHIWFGLSHYIGSIVSKILLSIIFFCIVTPMGLIRKKLGKDPMLLKNWKQGRESVFVKRDKTFSAEDLEKPY